MYSKLRNYPENSGGFEYIAILMPINTKQPTLRRTKEHRRPYISIVLYKEAVKLFQQCP